MFLLKPWHRAIGVAAFAGVGLSVLTWIAWNDPAINFLSRDKRAEWVVFPAAVDAHAHWFASLDATFRREFVLTDRPATARLGVRAMRGAEVRINGGPIRFPSNRNWKAIVSVDVAVSRGLRREGAPQIHQLHPGTPRIAVGERRLGNVSAAALLLDCRGQPFSVQTVNQRSCVHFITAFDRRVLGHRPIHLCFS